MENLVVIDLGSNSCRMTVTQIQKDGSYQVTHQLKEMVRLSEDEMLTDEPTLQPAAIERTITALQAFKAVYSHLPNVTLKAVATAATRVATNQKKFLRQVKAEVGLDLNVIPGTTEAYYDYLGVVNTLPTTNCVMMDTGGGSCELVLIINGQAKHSISLPIGAVNLSEKFDLNDQVTASNLFEAMTFVDKIFNSVWWLRQGLNLPLVCLGGSNRTLAKINRRQGHFLNFEDIHGYRLSHTAIYQTFNTILTQDSVGRAKIPGLAKERADIIVGGMIPAITLMRFLDADRMIFSQNGLREGVFFEHLTALDQKIKG
ncbi:exopolyphosphatase [Lactiplantibacillus mudanjiangensis]|uniref:exopolyphosphatase n=1 Tax=Lactiplantibacillus mudanjiangensis TaxID=1296538 RepID=A0A660DYD2_9LACO|nr:exopolyphosphatase [Lactiplantibacillus mudanjiangensis]VDG17857.1 exopolyphosphatase [Lactobacillus plantarum JDM1] [Lactiplantibacillus mudanjiangensis]VDG23303.1 exopolyphosphatase [Lactobacillus plantarum JDM1] [Lactiplantibacillus mudanjiangensis]VDG28263.1 exopolyphosphatase [Lactobacillus plantarum JDM1] [Lactiplantibacillus mudanjiangensis]VDG32445.1 exopolyphosphatase [Lactobacillus plantarum JDM1] [Lactiplantibacillus mudanjiangensis]